MPNRSQTCAERSMSLLSFSNGYEKLKIDAALAKNPHRIMSCGWAASLTSFYVQSFATQCKHKKRKAAKSVIWRLFFCLLPLAATCYGDGGSRTRVQTHRHFNFYAHSHSISISRKFPPNDWLKLLLVWWSLLDFSDGKIQCIPLRVRPGLEHMGDAKRIYANCF